MGKYTVAEVFVQTGYPEHTYSKREITDMNFEMSLQDGGTHIYLFGYSKSGKSCMWKNYLKSDDIIEIKVTEEMTKESFFKEVVNKLGVYIETERESETGNESVLSGSVSGKTPIFSAKAGAEHKSGDIEKVKYLKAANPGLTLTTVTDEVTSANKIIIMEDFHIAKSQFVKEISSVLKAFADNKVKVIIVGIENRLSEIYDARNDIKGRIKAYNVSEFKNSDLKEIINKGEKCLNINISEAIKNFLVNESFHKAYVLQALCRILCNLEDVQETLIIKKEISNLDNAKKACEYLAFSEDSTYANTVRVIAQSGRKSNKQQTYLWLLRVLKNYSIGEEGIELKDIFQRIRALGNDEMTQGSVNSCVAYIPNVLEKNKNVINVFKYENKRLYVIDEFFQFYLKWALDLHNELQI